MAKQKTDQNHQSINLLGMPSISVAVIEPVGGHGGMDFYGHQLCESLTNAGCRVILYTSSGYSATERCYTLIDSFAGVFGKENKWRRALRFIRASIKTFTSARVHGASVAHFQIFHVGVLEYMNIMMARVMGLRVVITAHDVGSFRAGESTKLLRKVYANSNTVIAHSQTAKNSLVHKLGLDLRRVYYIPHGNYVGLLPPLPTKAVAKKQFGMKSDEFVVLFFGQCKKVKRLDLLIEGVARARERGASRLRLLIAGTIKDADGEALAQQVRARLGEAAIHHPRYIANSEMQNYFAAADVAVLPYDQIFQSGVVLLAMTYGVPVLTSDIEGMVEIVRHKGTGLNFRAGDVEDLTLKLIEIERGDWPIEDYAKAAQFHVISNHAWSQCGQSTADIYRRMHHVY